MRSLVEQPVPQGQVGAPRQPWGERAQQIGAQEQALQLQGQRQQVRQPQEPEQRAQQAQRALGQPQGQRPLAAWILPPIR